MHNDASMARCDVTKKHSDVNYVWRSKDLSKKILYSLVTHSMSLERLQIALTTMCENAQASAY